jgi:hypothetical protein
MYGEYFLPEITGQGCALFDYDADGDLDIFLVQGAWLESGEIPIQHSSQDAPSDRLYRNELTTQPGNSSFQFIDVTTQSRIVETAYGMGVAAGDVNNDGYVDLYVTNLGSNCLLINQRDGSFKDVIRSAGADDTRWSTSASFLDFDRDGFLDLYVANYVDFRVEKNRICYAASSARDYCGPDAYTSVPDSLFRNRGDATFENVSSSSGISGEYGAALGVVAADFDNDGWIDIYVANDGDENQLWLNQKDGTFANEAVLAGVAVNHMGVPEASMGVDAADIDEDGDVDLFLAHIMEETNTLYLNEGNGFFADATIEAGLALPSIRRTAFGTGWFDYDNDGWLDLLVLNGAVTIIAELAKAGDSYPLHQPNQLFRNNGNTTFEEITERAGDSFRLSEVSRGAAFGDVDNDGDTDILVANSRGPARLLLNNCGRRNDWLGLKLVDKDRKRDMLGATVEITSNRGVKRFRRVKTDGSFCSSNDPRILVGLGDAELALHVRVRWPDGIFEEWHDLKTNRYHTLYQGSAPKSD